MSVMFEAIKTSASCLKVHFNKALWVPGAMSVCMAE